MPFKHAIRIANPSPYDRSDYVEVDLECANVPGGLDRNNLRLLRNWATGSCEEPFQIDYPFGKDSGYRILTLFSRNTPAGDPDYERHTADFTLEEAQPSDFSDRVDATLLGIQLYTTQGKKVESWEPDGTYRGVKLLNGGAASEQREISSDGLQAYFSLVPRPENSAPLNYAGAATSVLHHRAWRGGAADVLAPVMFQSHSPDKRWGQLTHIDVAPLPWERRPYHVVSMLGEPPNEPAYTLVWANPGPLRATVVLKSAPISLHFDGKPFLPGEVELTCHLYRMISMYPRKEFYVERLFLRPDKHAGKGHNRLTLPFRAYYCSHVDLPEAMPLRLARFEDIPDYFCVWRSFGEQNRGYAFASEMHIRKLRPSPSHIHWRLDRGHEHRCIHFFPFHGFSEGGFDPFHEIGHAWYESIYKPLLSLPLARYVLY